MSEQAIIQTLTAAENTGVRQFRTRSGIGGQQLSERDNIGWWIWREIEAAVLKKNGITT